MTVLTHLLSVTAYSAVIYAVIMLFRLILKKHASPKLRYVVWFVLIARLIIPVTVDSGFSLITIPAAQTAVQEQVAGAPSAAGEGAAADSFNTEPGVSSAQTAQGSDSLRHAVSEYAAAAPGFTLDLPTSLLFIWIAGMVLMLLQTLAAYVKLKRRLLRDSVPVPHEWTVLAESIKQDINLKGSVRIIMVKDLASPALNAGFSTAVLMPERMAVEDTEKTEFALRHELMHLKRKDHVVCLLMIILRIIYWFNPVVWLASKQIKADMETACDSEAVSLMSRETTKRYAATLLEMYAKEKVRFALGMSLGGTRKTAEQRVRGIFMRKRSSVKAKIAAAALALVMLTACFTTACQPVQESPSATVINTPTSAPTIEPTTEPTSEPTIEPTTEPTNEPTSEPTIEPTAAPSPTAEKTPEPVAQLPRGVTEEAKFRVDTDGDGAKETLVVGSVNDGNDIRLYVLYSGGYKKIDIDEGTFKCAYLTSTAGGRICLLISIDEASEDYVTYVFSFDGTRPVLRDDAPGYAYDVDATRVTLSGHLDVIGTWDYTRRFRLKNDFTLEQTSDYSILENWMEPLHTIRDLPAEMLEGDEYVAATLAPGTIITPVSTDKNSYMRFRLEDGSTGRIQFVRGENVEVYIGGIVESEYFDNIEYSD